MIGVPSQLSQIAAVAVDGEKNLWVGGREGVFYSQNSGASWARVHNLETPQVDGMYFDRAGNRMLLTTSVSLTFICSKAFCMCWTWCEAYRTSICRCRQ